MSKLHILAIILVLLGAINTTAKIVNIDAIEELGKSTNKYVSSIVYALIGVSVLYILFDRNTYLPFLGKTVFPCDILTPRTPEGANYSINVKAKSNKKIIYWAAEPSDKDNRKPKDAYNGYKNSGVAFANDKGIVTFHLKKPSGYKVPIGKLLPHVHYRICRKDGMLGKVKTVFL